MRGISPKTVYYTDPLTDDFAGVQKAYFDIPHDFKFIRDGALWRALSFCAYRLIMTPFAYLYCKIKFHLHIVDRTTAPIKAQKGCFLYLNHTLLAGDAFIPTLAAFPKKVYVIVSPENISSPSTRKFILMNGAIPLPQSPSAFRHFAAAVDRRVDEGHCVAVYPEAHIWPYCTEIRPYPSNSFRFPVRSGAPVYVSTTTFRKKRLGRTPSVTVWLDGPFYPDADLPQKKAEQKLRDTAYGVMCENAKKSTFRPIEYKKRDEQQL